VAERTETGARQWLQENRAAMDGWNDDVEQHGLPLTQYRQL
jgi:post-segregation antitoxin (ccd killing protein)